MLTSLIVPAFVVIFWIYFSLLLLFAGPAGEANRDRIVIGRIHQNRKSFWQNTKWDGALNFLIFAPFGTLLIALWDFVLFPLFTPRLQWNEFRIARDRKRLKNHTAAAREKAFRESERYERDRQALEMIQSLRRDLQELSHQFELYADTSVPLSAMHRARINQEIAETEEKIEKLTEARRLLAEPVEDRTDDALSAFYSSYDGQQERADELLRDIGETLRFEQNARAEIASKDSRHIA